MEAKSITAGGLVNVLEHKNYKIFSQSKLPLNLNIIGVRSRERTANRFDDYICLVWQDNLKWELKTYPATTDPGSWELINPSFYEAKVNGTAILVEGQYLSSWTVGWHGAGTFGHEALIQSAPISIYRDKTKDEVLNLDPKTITKGIYGIDIHRANANIIENLVQNYSAGCQVIQNPTHFKEFMQIIKLSAQYWGKTFSYTLINEEDLLTY